MVEFKINKCPELEFRVVKISPIDILAIMDQMNFASFENSKQLYAFALEHIEVKQGEKWFPVKYPGKDIYTPTFLEDDVFALNEIIGYFLNEIITKNFTNSRE